MPALVENTTIQEFLTGSGVLERTKVIRLLQQEMLHPESTFDDVIEMANKDAGLRTQILATATTARFGGSAKHCTMREAFGLLGVEEFQRVLITSTIKQNIADEISPDFSQHADLIACLCEKIAVRSTPDFRLNAFLTGLCHDCAVPVMSNRLVDYQYFVEQAFSNDTSVLDLETECHSFDHSEASAQIVKQLDLPHTIVEAIQIHHTPERLKELQGESATLAAILILAERVVQIARQEISSVFLGSNDVEFERQTFIALSMSREGLQKLVAEQVSWCAQKLRQPA